MTIWIDEAVLARIPDDIPTRGWLASVRRYANSGSTGREDHLSTDVARPARFHKSLRDLAFPGLPVSNYTTLCRRTKTLDVELPILRASEPIYLVVDSTDLKVYWRRYGRLRASMATRSGARGAQSISRSMRIRINSRAKACAFPLPLLTQGSAWVHRSGARLVQKSSRAPSRV
ncbi:MAG: transposase [Burkholderia sp.]